VNEGLVRKVGREAKRAGLFLLYHDVDGRWEFLSGTSGKSILSWWQKSGTWISGKKRGKSRSPFGAMQAAIREDRYLTEKSKRSNDGT